MGDRLGHLRDAARAIHARAPVLAASRVYETAPVGPAQADFLNAAVALAWPAEPMALLGALLDIERALGRVRDVRWGPRTIDLDILWIDGVVHDEPALVVPHPHLTERDFALAPLLDVAPQAVDPRTGQRFERPDVEGAIRLTDLTLL